VRFTCIGQLARWLSGAKLYVGNDSGIAHLAAAVGVPVAVFFGPTDPAVWAPRGPSVTVLRQMETLSAEAAADAILAVPALT
jgi:heptosyltransferase III